MSSVPAVPDVQDDSPPKPAAPVPATGAATAKPFTPSLRLFADTLVIESTFGAAQEIKTAVATLSFDYDGTRIKAADARDRFFRTTEAGLVSVPRALAAEKEARRLIEGFGATELECLGAASAAFAADYAVDAEGDVHAICAFMAYAVPQLRTHGWRVDVDAAFPWQTIDGTGGWWATVDEADKSPGWFNFELGIEVDDQRVNLLPLLVELLERAPDGMDLDSLARTCRRCLALPLMRNKYLAVKPERLRSILRVLLELYRPELRGSRAALQFPAFQAAALAHLDLAFDAGALAWQGAPALRARGARAAVPWRAEPDALPQELRATLRPYQKQGVAWLQRLRADEVGGVLADDMGLGKTLQTISHLVIEKATGRLTRPAIIVCPTSLVGNWQREVARFAPGLRLLPLHGPKRFERLDEIDSADVVLTTYPLVLRDQEVLAGVEFHIAILDEAQWIKNQHSQVHKAVKRIEARHRLCLTGTPIENSLSELWAIFDFLVPGLLGTAESFRNTFANPIEKDGSEGRLEALRERLAPFILRRVKKQVAPELPPKTEIVRPVELAGAQRDLYESIRLSAHEKVRQVIRDKGIAGSAVDILDALMKLRQVCCDPRLVRVDAARAVQESAKYELLFDMLETLLAEQHRVLIFSQFTTMLALIAGGLRERDRGHALLTGATADRQAQVDLFQGGKVDVFLISLKAGGTGLNLTSADTVIHYDPWWNPAAQAQATDRAYRIGQTQPVFSYNLIVAGSVEERILALQRKKRNLADSLLPSGAERVLDFSKEEIEDLFAPLAPQGTGGATVVAPAAATAAVA